MKTILAVFGLAAALAAQQSDMVIKLTGGTTRAIAVPDMRGGGASGKLMDTFNQVLWADLQEAGLLKMAPKSFYPLAVPQRPEDMRNPGPPAPARRGEQPKPPACGGACLVDWGGPPVNASYLTVGYAAEVKDQFVYYGWLLNTQVGDIGAAQVFKKFYMGALDENGARKTAHEFAADILTQFGVQTLAGSKIYYVCEVKTGFKEICVMDYDGANQRRVTSFGTLTLTPAVSADGTRLAVTSYGKTGPQILMYSLESSPIRRLPFLSPQASMNATPAFTPDGKQVLFSSTLTKDYAHIYIANADGSGLRPLTSTRAVEVEPKVNPKTGADVVFVSGRGGLQQIYRMNMDGADASRVTNGEGEAANPCWHPNGQHIAFKWTRGFAPGNWNIFVMDVASKETVQLTYGEGRNENPYWAPDGRHLVFSSNRSGSYQIYTMLADGTQVRRLTTRGNNTMPVWGK